MKINKTTIEALAAEGIIIRWYPCQTFEEWQKICWEKEYNGYIEYYKDCVGDNCTANKLYNNIEELQEQAKKHADIWVKYNAERTTDANILYIEYGGKLIMKKENIKSKEITIDYVRTLVNKNEKLYNGYYGTFALNMQKILKDNNLGNQFAVYPTQYGIGIWVLYNYNANEKITEVTNILDRKGVEYYNEYSEAGWVYRFKVSKRAENLAKVAA